MTERQNELMADGGAASVSESTSARTKPDFSSATDLALMGALHSDARAMRELVRRHAGYLTSVVSRALRRPSDVQDVVQNVWVKVYAAADSFDGDSEFTTWLYRIAINASYDFIRMNGKFFLMDSLDDNPDLIDGRTACRGTLPPEIHPAEAIHLRRCIVAGFDALAPAHQQVLTLVADGLRYKQISDEVGVPLGTVMSRLFHARRLFRDVAGDICVDLS